MRVISGIARGTNLYTLEGLETRPTTDRIKETIFNIIQHDLTGKNFLDICSGSGSIGIEAISRGANAVFIEKSKKACEIIHKNLLKTKFTDRSDVINNDALIAVKALKTQFDIIFIDPPYENEFTHELLLCIAQKNLLTNGGFIMLEQDSAKDLLIIPELKIDREKIFKRTKIVFYSFV